MIPPKTANEHLFAAGQRLRAAQVPDPGRDARLLLADALKIAPTRLTLILPDPVPVAAAQRFERSIAARCQRQPVSHILGRRSFYGRDFIVTSDVLDPRPETECLIELALKATANMASPALLDLGTGTGCILLTLLAELPLAKGVGTDISEPVLAVARRNCDALDLASRARFTQSDWFGNVQGRFDLIVSNPPYITADEMVRLSPEVRLWEPHLALTPGGDGLSAYRKIAAEAANFLRHAGRIIVEIGTAQGPDVVAIFVQAGLVEVAFGHDLDGKARMVSGRRGAN